MDDDDEDALDLLASRKLDEYGEIYPEEIDPITLEPLFFIEEEEDDEGI